MDKTGTLTEGRFRLHQMAVGNQATTERVVQLAASVEALSSHPVCE